MIRFKNVTKDFGGETPALDDISFEIQDGEFLFLTGHSGSGKSTLLKIITKEYLPTSGEVEFNDVPLSKIRGRKIHRHRRQIGVVFQDYRLLPELNIWENIALPLEIMGRANREIEERVTDLLELVQLTEKAHVFPSQLSGGESQRVGVARALATAPAVLLADEPTGNLDPQNTMLIARLFNKINELGTTIIFATHDPVILGASTHRRINLNKGKISEDTPATDKNGKPLKKTPAQEAKASTKALMNEHEKDSEKVPPKKIAETDRTAELSPPKTKVKPSAGKALAGATAAANSTSKATTKKATDADQLATLLENAKVTTEVENLDDTPVASPQADQAATNSRKGLLPHFHLRSPFGRRHTPSSAHTNPDPGETDPVLPETDPDLAEVMFQIEKLEDDKK